MEYKYVGINDNENCEKLDILLEKFSNHIDLNIFLIKEKIKNKLEIIKHLRTFGFSILNYDKDTGKGIIDKLNKINENDNIAIYNDNLNKILGGIIHNIYEHSEYQILMSNVPEYGVVKTTNIYDKITCNIIYDTIIHYGGNCNVLDIFQTSRSSYLIKFEDNNDAKYISNLLDKTLIDKNVIKVDYFGNRNEQSVNKQPCNKTKSVRFSDVFSTGDSNGDGNGDSNCDGNGDKNGDSNGICTGNGIGYSYITWFINKINNIVMYLLPSSMQNKNKK